MNNTIVRTALFVIVSAWILVGTGGYQAFAQTSKNEFVEAVAVGETKEEAKANAVHDMLLNGLEAIIGDEAYGSLGDEFFATYGKSFKAMKKRFFTSDFTSECDKDSEGYRCLVEAEMRFGALDSSAKKIISKNKKAAGSNRSVNKKYKIIANVGVEKNRRNDKLLGLIRKAFSTYGHTFTYVDTFKNLDTAGIDFGISLKRIDFVGFKHNKYTKRFEGGLDVMFELTRVDFKKMQADVITSDVVTVSTYVNGTNPETMERELETRLMKEASNRFVQTFNSNIEAFLSAQ